MLRCDPNVFAAKAPAQGAKVSYDALAVAEGVAQARGQCAFTNDGASIIQCRRLGVRTQRAKPLCDYTRRASL